MRRSVFIGGVRLRIEGAPSVTAGGEVDGEGKFAVGAHVPAKSTKLVVANVGECEALPREASGLPEQAGGAYGGDCVEAGEEKQVGIWRGQDLSYGAQCEMEWTFGCEGVGEVSIAAGDGEKVVRTWAGPDAGESVAILEAESAGCEEAATRCRLYLQEQRAASERVFLSGDTLRPGELACRCDEWWSGEDLG